MTVRIAFLGTPEPAVPALRALLDAPEVDVEVVVTNPDRPRGRGHRLAPPPVKVVAEEAGVPVWQPVKPREVADDLAALDLDAAAVVAYGSILPRAVLDTVRHGFVNLHFSVLPAWRGAAPVPAAILAGDATAGVSCFVLEEGMDTGPVLVTATTPIQPSETAGELTARLAQLGAPALVDAITGLVDGSLTAIPQDAERATYASKISPDDAAIDWTADAADVDRRIRAFQPVPGAWTTFDGERLKVHRARPVAGSGRPGLVLRVDRGASGPGGAADDPDGDPVVASGWGGPVVACGSGAVRLDEVQPAGRPRMGGIDFANGHRPVGSVLGAS